MKDNRTHPQNKDFDANYERIFGKRDEAKPQGRRRFVFREGRCVAVGDDFVDAPRAIDAPIMAGRFYENNQATDGVDIGSRAKHRAYMKQNGLTTVDDYQQEFKTKADERAQFYQGNFDRKERREQIERVFHHHKP